MMVCWRQNDWDYQDLCNMQGNFWKLHGPFHHRCLSGFEPRPEISLIRANGTWDTRVTMQMQESADASGHGASFWYGSRSKHVKTKVLYVFIGIHHFLFNQRYCWIFHQSTKNWIFGKYKIFICYVFILGTPTKWGPRNVDDLSISPNSLF